MTSRNSRSKLVIESKCEESDLDNIFAVPSEPWKVKIVYIMKGYVIWKGNKYKKSFPQMQTQLELSETYGKLLECEVFNPCRSCLYTTFWNQVPELMLHCV